MEYEYNKCNALRKYSFSLMDRDSVVGVSTGNMYPIVSYSMHFDQVWIYVIISNCYKKKMSLIKDESCIYFPVDRHLCRTWGLYLFINLAVMGFSPGLMTSTIMVVGLLVVYSIRIKVSPIY